MELSELLDDLSAFADEEEEVVIEPSGAFMLLRNGKELTGDLLEKPDGELFVRRNTREVPYREFLLNDLAGLRVFGERLVARRAPVEWYVDGNVEVSRPGEDPIRGGAKELLQLECEDAPPFASRITFITADAGHGKTALLRQFQFEQAKRYLAGEAGYLFWHVDLQGRQLLRLSEALMGDLGELRITGLWMPAIVRLMRRRALVLGIDGFDELAAEQGSTDAIGALASLVGQLGGRGTIVAAARRTFFDTDDYVRRAGVVGRAILEPCEFNQMALLPWTRTEGVEFLGAVATASSIAGRDPGAVYDEVVDALGGTSEHPMLARPFLFAQVVRALTAYGISPAEFISTVDEPFSGIAAVVQAFVRREVTEKWKTRDTGESYLSEMQHMQLLADVAEEMYRSQKDRLDLDVVETIAALLLEQWDIEQERRPQILEMTRMHVLLVPGLNDPRSRGFDHPEFRDYFIAYALRSHIERAMSGSEFRGLAQFLTTAQLTDSTARYVCSMIDRSEQPIRVFLRAAESALRTEWKPTFFQLNLGTLIPYLLSGVEWGEVLEFEGNAIFSSLVFERSEISNVTLRGCSFVNASLAFAAWRNVTLEKCTLGEILLDRSTSFENVRLIDCSIEGVRVRDGYDEEREYAPQRILARLESFGAEVAVTGAEGAASPSTGAETDTVRVFRRFLRLFGRTTVVTDDQVRGRFRQDQQLVLEVLVPLLVRAEVLKATKWKGAGHRRIWALTERVEDVLAAEDGGGAPRLAKLWREVRAL